MAARHLSTMLNAGVPIGQALTLLREPVMREVLKTVENGAPLSEAWRRFPECFPPIMVVTTRVGERSGALTACLERIAAWLERDEQLVRKVRLALTYPLFILGLSGGLSLLLCVTILPGFIRLLTDLGAPLPWPTRLLVWWTAALSHPAFWALSALLIVALVARLRQLLRTPAGRLQLGQLLHVVPVLGPLLSYVALSRLSSSLALMLEAGHDFLTSVRLAVQSSGHPLFEENLPLMVRALTEGESLGVYLRAHRELYPGTFGYVVGVAEESARMVELLRLLARQYEEEVDYRLEIFTSLLEPLLLGAVSILVAFIMIAMMLPFFALMGSLA